jgi:hypothetical protein
MGRITTAAVIGWADVDVSREVLHTHLAEHLCTRRTAPLGARTTSLRLALARRRNNSTLSNHGRGGYDTRGGFGKRVVDASTTFPSPKLADLGFGGNGSVLSRRVLSVRKREDNGWMVHRRVDDYRRDVAADTASASTTTSTIRIAVHTTHLRALRIHPPQASGPAHRAGPLLFPSLGLIRASGRD